MEQCRTVEDFEALGLTRVTKDGGVLKRVDVAGEEAEYEDDDETPPEGAMVSVHYTGTFPESGRQFESSRERGQPLGFTIGDGRVIRGWDAAVRTMRKGEKCTCVLQPKYAYGKKGAAGIPADATLCFELELVEWV